MINIKQAQQDIISLKNIVFSKRKSKRFSLVIFTILLYLLLFFFPIGLMFGSTDLKDIISMYIIHLDLYLLIPVPLFISWLMMEVWVDDVESMRKFPHHGKSSKEEQKIKDFLKTRLITFLSIVLGFEIGLFISRWFLQILFAIKFPSFGSLFWKTTDLVSYLIFIIAFSMFMIIWGTYCVAKFGTFISYSPREILKRYKDKIEQNISSKLEMLERLEDKQLTWFFYMYILIILIFFFPVLLELSDFLPMNTFPLISTSLSLILLVMSAFFWLKLPNLVYNISKVRLDKDTKITATLKELNFNNY